MDFMKVFHLISIQLYFFFKISDESSGYAASQFALVSHYEEVVESVLIPHGLIQDRIEKLALDISADSKSYENGITAICVLKGGFRFFADLTGAIDRINRSSGKSIRITSDFIKVKSYIVSVDY